MVSTFRWELLARSRGKSVWVHTVGYIKKVASCKVKPFQLVDRKSIKDSSSKEIMLEDGLEDVKNLMDQGELKEDNIRAKYLRMINTVSFSELCNYTVELPASKHGTTEVKAAKMSNIRNLKEYDTFKEVPDEGQETIGS